MLELVLVVCSVVEGAKCRELPPVSLEPPTHIVACMLATQIEAVKWSESHPNYYVQKSICRPARTFAKA
jgi:hypothetical protein